MTSSLVNSPALSRISVDHPSIATTVSARSSNLGSPIIGSPATSGSLSPLGLGGTPNASVSYTFKKAIKPKKLLPSSYSAFRSRDEAVFSSLKYEKFQKHVQRVKYAQAMEKDEKKSPLGRRVNSPLSLRAPASVFKEELSEKTYFKQFPMKAKRGKDGSLEPVSLFNVHVASSAVSRYNRDVCACEMGDSIAVFCLSKKEVIVHHVSSGSTTIKAVSDQFEKFPRIKKASYQIYLVGGDGSPESVQLLGNINSAILIFFGNKGLIKETFINPNRDSDEPYISVACTTQKQFFFCRHD